MTALMEYLFKYLDEECVSDYLALDPEYRISSARTDAWSMQLPKHLDEAGQQLFQDYQQAQFQEHLCTLKAMFQATVDLCRELNGALR